MLEFTANKVSWSTYNILSSTEEWVGGDQVEEKRAGYGGVQDSQHDSDSRTKKV